MQEGPENDINYANAVSNGWTGGVRLFLAVKAADRIAIVSGFQMKIYARDEGIDIPEPASLNLNKASAQLLIDALWSVGMRPSGELESVGQKDALKKHLEDMRQIAFKTLSVEKPV